MDLSQQVARPGLAARAAARVLVEALAWLVQVASRVTLEAQAPVEWTVPPAAREAWAPGERTAARVAVEAPEAAAPAVMQALVELPVHPPDRAAASATLAAPTVEREDRLVLAATRAMRARGGARDAARHAR